MTEPLKLWKLTRSDHFYHDVYKAAVVVAATEDAARHIHPDENATTVWHEGAWASFRNGVIVKDEYAGADWTHPDNVIVSFLGIAFDDIINQTVILSQYNAG